MARDEENWDAFKPHSSDAVEIQSDEDTGVLVPPPRNTSPDPIDSITSEDETVTRPKLPGPGKSARIPLFMEKPKRMPPADGAYTRRLSNKLQPSQTVQHRHSEPEIITIDDEDEEIEQPAAESMPTEQEVSEITLADAAEEAFISRPSSSSMHVRHASPTVRSDYTFSLSPN